MDEGTELEPLVLFGRPSCVDCLAWNEDHLAVAVGDHVYVLTPQFPALSNSRTPSKYSEERFRVNQFGQDEWPYQYLASLRDFSLGEEQSESTVISIAWSPAGLGPHMRSVLAILTSNLVLSFWESNGTPGNWQRTHTVNPRVNESDAGSAAFKRRSQRIRAFAWLPALKYPATSRYGMHWLLTVDDNNVITCFRVQRDVSRPSTWSLRKTYQSQLWTAERPSLNDEVSPLQSLLVSQSPTTKITVGSWQTLRHENGSTKLFRIMLSLRRGATESQLPEHPYMLEAEPTATGIDFSSRSLSPKAAAVPGDLTSPQGFAEAVTKHAEEFSTKYRLDGHVRTRYWGFAKDSKNGVIAACITLHPADMIEDRIAATGQSIIIFAKQDRSISSAVPATSEPPVLKILYWIRAHATKENLKSEFDEKAVKVAASAINAAFYQMEDLVEWSRTVQDLLSMSTNVEQPGNGNTEMRSAANETPSRDSKFAEACEVCESEVLMTSDLSIARCGKGHVFTRCSISFVAIQAPGISKFCARCGQQFLDPTKLEATTGPSLVQALFEEFDVCPYCQGKFRG